MRRAHFIRPNDRNETAHNAVWLDTEGVQTWTDATHCEQSLAFGWLAHRRRLRHGNWSSPHWTRFTSPLQCWRSVTAVTRPKTTTYVFCHNSSYDYVILDCFRELPKLGWELKRACIEAPPTIIVFRRNGAKLVLLDTLNWWRVPLKKIGEVVGIPKLDFGFCHAALDDHDAYCRRDVEVIMAQCLSWWEFLREHDMGGFAPTLASQSMRSYRHRGMRHTILVDDDETALNLARQAYHGGRCEPFALGRHTGPFTCLDINSMYPAVMAANVYPTVLRGVRNDLTLGELAHAIERYALVACVEIDARRPVYPCYRGERLVFPLGRFTTTLTTPELRYALEAGDVLRVFSAAAYLAAPIFSQWVRAMYALRVGLMEADDTVSAFFIKILMNSLYGKFGQRGYVFESDGHTDDLSARQWVEYDAETGKTTKHRQFGGLVQSWQNEGESRDSHPAIAAHVTAYARMLLWSMMEQAGRENVYYVDTDSLIVNDAGAGNLAALIDPHELGALKVERTAGTLRIWGPKDYALGDYKRTKGVRQNATWLGPNHVEQQRWQGLTGWVGAGMGTGPIVDLSQKRLRRDYGRARLRPDGRLDPPRYAELD